MKATDLTGQKFGRLTAVRAEREKGKRTRWVCRCECGIEHTVDQTHLTRGNTRSCGCLNSEVAALRNNKNAKHGMWKSKEFALWTGMLARCYNKNHDQYPRYGGRGIIVCAEWRDSFQAFFSHMGVRPSPKHSIERNDNNGNYEPANVRWATVLEQANNRRNNRFVEWGGESLTVAQLARRYGLTDNLVGLRVRRGVTGAALVAPSQRGAQR